jgi:type II secretory pathway pseudopilin PulG
MKKSVKIGLSITIGIITVFCSIWLFVRLTLQPIVDKRTEEVVRSNLQDVRSAISIYYSDHNRKYPASFNDLATTYWPVGHRPTLWNGRKGLFPHPPTDEWIILKNKTVNDSGKWAYVYAPGTNSHGELFIDCTHLDSKSKAWSEY